MTATRRWLPLLLALLACPSVACAHRLDEYLQATRVAIEPGGLRLEINLTPGVAVADQVLARIDRDRDGLISTNEAAVYADLLIRDLVVRLDERKLELTLSASTFATPADLRTGWGIIQMELSASPGPLAAGAHSLTFENRHLADVSVYLINAARPTSNAIRIIAQKRNDNQSSGEIAFAFYPEARPHPDVQQTLNT